jgi:hypothetical protein
VEEVSFLLAFPSIYDIVMMFVPVKLVTSGFSAHFFFDFCARESGGFDRKRFFIFRPGLGSGHG